MIEKGNWHNKFTLKNISAADVNKYLSEGHLVALMINLREEGFSSSCKGACFQARINRCLYSC